MISLKELQQYLDADEEKLLLYIHEQTNDSIKSSIRNFNGNGVPVKEGCEGLYGPPFYTALFGLEGKRVNNTPLLHCVTLTGETLHSIHEAARNVVDQLYKMRNSKT